MEGSGKIEVITTFLPGKERRNARPSWNRRVGGQVLRIESMGKYFSSVAIRTADRLARSQLPYRLCYPGIVIVAIRLNVEVMSDDFSMYQMFAETDTTFRNVNKAAVVMLMELEEWTFMRHRIILISSRIKTN